AGSYILLGQPSDKFHGRGGKRLACGYYCGSRGGRVRRIPERRRNGRERYSSSRICRIIHSGRRGFVKRQRDACVEKETDRISLLPDSADVFFNGTYDVELAGPFLYGK